MDYMAKIDRAALEPQQGSGANNREVDHRSFLGAAAALCGTLAAIISIPADPRPSGALIWPAVWCSIGLLTAPLLGLRNSIQTILRTENLLMIGLIYWLLLDLLQGAYPIDVSYDDVSLAFTALGTMAVGIWVGTLGTGWSPPQLVLRVAKRQFSSAMLFRALWVAFFLGMFYFAYSSDFDLSIMIEALGWCRFCAPWSTSESGGWNAFAVHLQYFGFVLPSLTVLIAHREGWLRPKAIVGTILSIVMVMFFAQGGGRRVIGVVIGAALLTWLVLQVRLRPKFLIGGLIGAILILVFMELMFQVRTFGYSASYQETGLRSQALVRVDDNFLRLCQIMHLVPDVQPYVDLQPLYYALAMPIPRALWEGKPSDPGYNLPKLLGFRGASLSQSIIGELYAMHGLIVVFLGGLIFGRIANMWNKILDVSGADRSMIYGIGVMILFTGLRSTLDLVIMSYGLLGWFVIVGLLPHTRSEALPTPG